MPCSSCNLLERYTWDFLKNKGTYCCAVSKLAIGIVAYCLHFATSRNHMQGRSAEGSINDSVVISVLFYLPKFREELKSGTDLRSESELAEVVHALNQ